MTLGVKRLYKLLLNPDYLTWLELFVYYNLNFLNNTPTFKFIKLVLPFIISIIVLPMNKPENPIHSYNLFLDMAIRKLDKNPDPGKPEIIWMIEDIKSY